MTLKDAIEQMTGYKCFTTFDMDFSIAERFGLSAVQDTFDRAFDEWKSNTKYLTEFVMILNWKIWLWNDRYEKETNIVSKNNAYMFAELYDKLWRQADEWACENLQGEDASYYFRTLD